MHAAVRLARLQFNSLNQNPEFQEVSAITKFLRSASLPLEMKFYSLQILINWIPIKCAHTHHTLCNVKEVCRLQFVSSKYRILCHTLVEGSVQISNNVGDGKRTGGAEIY